MNYWENNVCEECMRHLNMHAFKSQLSRIVSKNLSSGTTIFFFSVFHIKDNNTCSM